MRRSPYNLRVRTFVSSVKVRTLAERGTMKPTFESLDARQERLFLPGPPASWWLPIFGTLQAYCWRTVGAM